MCSDMTLLLERAPTMALAVSECIAALTALSKASKMSLQGLCYPTSN